LREKQQSEQRQKQARHSVTMFYRVQYKPVALTEELQPLNSLVRITENGANPLTPVDQDSSVTPAEIYKTTQGRQNRQQLGVSP
jgi:hypothetical protein